MASAPIAQAKVEGLVEKFRIGLVLDDLNGGIYPCIILLPLFYDGRASYGHIFEVVEWVLNMEFAYVVARRTDLWRWGSDLDLRLVAVAVDSSTFAMCPV